MKREVLDALKKSIIHWEENTEAAKKGKEFYIGSSNCALCELFEESCFECPVGSCPDSPWGTVSHLKGEVSNKELATACQKEVNFLKSLLPKKKKTIRKSKKEKSCQ